MPAAPKPEEISRTDQPCLHASSTMCDLVGIACAVPCIMLSPLEYCCSGIFSYAQYAPEPQMRRAGLLDRWYRASIFSFHGGSMLQLLSTQPLFWRFPIHSQRDGYVLHDVVVAPANACGACCMAPVVRASEPQFRIRRLESGVYSVRLNAKVCGCLYQECSPYELNDVWRVSAGGDIITSVKTRGFAKCCLVKGDIQDYCITLPSAGPAMFVAVDPLGPTLRDVHDALRSTH